MPKLGNPLPQPLPKECAKADRICMSLCPFPALCTLMLRNRPAVNGFVDSGNNGLDGVRIILLEPLLLD